MHPVIAKLTPVVAQIRGDNSKTIESISLNPADIAELGIRPADRLFGAIVIPDVSIARSSAGLNIKQERTAFDEAMLRR